MFETALLSSISSVRRDSFLLPLSIAVHAAVVLGLAGASLWREEPLAEPALPIVFVAPGMPAPPPLGSPGGSAATHGAANAAIREVSARVPRLPRPSGLPTPSDTILDAPGTGQQQDGVGLGDPEGVPKGTGQVPGASGTGDGQGGDESRTFTVGGNVSAPVLLHRVEPDYPEAARRARMEGVVILQAVIDTAGQIEELVVVGSPFALLDQAALRAVRQWRYRPSTLNGRAVRVSLAVTVTFRLR